MRRSVVSCAYELRPRQKLPCILREKERERGREREISGEPLENNAIAAIAIIGFVLFKALPRNFQSAPIRTIKRVLSNKKPEETSTVLGPPEKFFDEFLYRRAKYKVRIV